MKKVLKICLVLVEFCETWPRKCCSLYTWTSGRWVGNWIPLHRSRGPLRAGRRANQYKSGHLHHHHISRYAQIHLIRGGPKIALSLLAVLRDHPPPHNTIIYNHVAPLCLGPTVFVIIIVFDATLRLINLSMITYSLSLCFPLSLSSSSLKQGRAP